MLVGALELVLVAVGVIVPVCVGGGLDCDGLVVVDLENVLVEVWVIVDDRDKEVVADFVLDAVSVGETVAERVLEGDRVLVPEPLVDLDVEIVREAVEDTDELLVGRLLDDD